MTSIERSKLWLNIEFQHWAGDFDDLIRFSLNEKGELHVEQFENIDPDDFLVAVDISDITNRFPRTPQQFLDALAQLAPNAFNVPPLCSTTFNGDPEVLKILPRYLNFSTKSLVPEDEWDFVLASRAHTPKRSTPEVTSMTSQRSTHKDKVLYLGRAEHIVLEAQTGGYAISVEDFKAFEQPSAARIFHWVEKLYGESVELKFSSLDAEHHLGSVRVGLEEVWVPLEGLPGHALAVFLRDKSRRMLNWLTGGDYNTTFFTHDISAFIESVSKKLGLIFRLESPNVLVQLNLENSFDQKIFRERFSILDKYVSKIDKAARAYKATSGEYYLYGPGSFDRVEVKYSLELQIIHVDGVKYWDIQFVSDLRSRNGLLSVKEHKLVDILLELFPGTRLTIIVDSKKAKDVEYIHLPDDWQIGVPAVSINLSSKQFDEDSN